MLPHVSDPPLTRPPCKTVPRMTGVNQRLMLSRDHTTDWEIQGWDLEVGKWKSGFKEATKVRGHKLGL